MNTGTTSSMACPVCQAALIMSERQGIEIDYCPSCRGVWLDRGELDKIIERGTAELPPARRPEPSRSPSWPGSERHGHPHGGDHYGYRKRKKSFLEELFD